jgi:hypothetical protein
MVAGRPQKLEFDDQLLTIIENLGKDGKTDAQIAQILGIGLSTLKRYKDKIPEFRAALDAGKSFADALVEQALFAKALGYHGKETKIVVVDKSVEKHTFIKWHPPDVQAISFWLRNRNPEKWKDKSEIEHSGETKLSLHAQIVKALKERDGEE